MKVYRDELGDRVAVWFFAVLLTGACSAFAVALIALAIRLGWWAVPATIVAVVAVRFVHRLLAKLI